MDRYQGLSPELAMRLMGYPDRMSTADRAYDNALKDLTALSVNELTSDVRAESRALTNRLRDYALALGICVDGYHSLHQRLSGDIQLLQHLITERQTAGEKVPELWHTTLATLGVELGTITAACTSAEQHLSFIEEARRTAKLVNYQQSTAMMARLAAKVRELGATR